MKKYISFAPYYSGFSNIIMNYECVFAVAYITKRTVILPPNLWCLFMSNSHEPKDYIDIWEVFDKEYVLSQFDCINFSEVPEFKGKYLMMSGHGMEGIDFPSYTNNIHKCIPEVKKIDFLQFLDVPEDIVNALCSSKQVITNSDYENDLDFEEFKQERETLNLSKFEDKILHFENNLFGHYWYSIYPGDEVERNKMKDVINRCFRFNDRIYYLSSKVSEKLGKYNAIHVRRSDFLITQTKSLEPVSDPNKLTSMVRLFFPEDVPLYISTDETDKSFFDELRKVYDIFFYEDFEYELSIIDKAAVEQTICSKAELFYGTYHSTFTKRINVMRGLEGRQSEDDMGINFYPFENRLDVVTANPWKLMMNKRWEWNHSSHPQWKIEKDGKYI